MEIVDKDKIVLELSKARALHKSNKKYIIECTTCDICGEINFNKRLCSCQRRIIENRNNIIDSILKED